ncbi:MAG: hypothetical protein ACXVCO_05150 [Ktedonobacterales bacterium]
MVIASESPAWLHTLGEIAGTILVIELSVALLIVAALAIGIAYGVNWVRQRVIPIVDQNAPRILDAMRVAEESSDKVVQGVAEFYGRRQAIQTGLRVLLFGRAAAERVREESAIQAAADLQAMSADETTIGPEDGFTPPPRALPPAEAYGPAGRRDLAAPARPSGFAVERRDTRRRQDTRDRDHNGLTPLAGSAG